MRYRIILLILLLAEVALAGNFFDTDFKTNKRYIILVNPTVRNIKTIQYLQNNGLLDVRPGKFQFVGVYSADQNYDFNLSEEYINESRLKHFHLHEVSCRLTTENLYGENECTEEFKKIFNHSVGIFFFGGPDIPPEVYGEKNEHAVVTDANRHLFEVTYLFHLLGGYNNEDFEAFLTERPDYLVTGFCLGMQTMNVATGGTLIQDIPAELYNAQDVESKLQIGRTNLHRNYWQEKSDDPDLMKINLHTIAFLDHPFFGSRVNVSRQSEPRIYSSHHQAVERLGKSLRATAVSPDGKVIEGVAHQKFRHVFAVQFHPEVPALYEKNDPTKRKFHPEDEPMNYYGIIGRKSVRFHKKYWEYISDCLKHVRKPGRK